MTIGRVEGREVGELGNFGSSEVVTDEPLQSESTPLDDESSRGETSLANSVALLLRVFDVVFTPSAIGLTAPTLFENLKIVLLFLVTSLGDLLRNRYGLHVAVAAVYVDLRPSASLTLP